jgi:hypothetical protein
MSKNDYSNTPNFGKVFEAWDQPSTTKNGWTYLPSVGTFGQGKSSHYTFNPEGKLDHYSTYDGYKKTGKW